MGELKRKEDELTTADLAARSSADDPITHEAPEQDRPRLVKRETPDAGYQQNTTVTPVQNTRGGASTLLFSESDVSDLRTHWSNVQAGFVDEPRRSVEEADKLVASVMKRLAEGFANERSTLEHQWDGGADVSTEDLRLALQRYRNFFDRLLSA